MRTSSGLCAWFPSSGGTIRVNLRWCERGRGCALSVPATENVAARFHDEHQRRYGYHHAGRDIELVTLRLRVRLRTPPLKVARRRAARKAAVRVMPIERAPVFFH